MPGPRSAGIVQGRNVTDYWNLGCLGEDSFLPESLIYPQGLGSFTCRMSPGVSCILRSLLLRNKWEFVSTDRKLHDDSHDSNLLS